MRPAPHWGPSSMGVGFCLGMNTSGTQVSTGPHWRASDLEREREAVLWLEGVSLDLGSALYWGHDVDSGSPEPGSSKEPGSSNSFCGKCWHPSFCVPQPPPWWMKLELVVQAGPCRTHRGHSAALHSVALWWPSWDHLHTGELANSSCLSASQLPALCWLWPSKPSHLSTLGPNQGLERVSEELPWWSSDEGLPSNAGGLGSILGRGSHMPCGQKTKQNIK